MINELIEQIGGRDALINFMQNGVRPSWIEVEMMSRALLAVLDAKPAGEAISPSLASIDNLELELGTKFHTIPPAPSVNYPAIPEGWIPMPGKLTEENGAKAALSGNFAEHKVINCPECFGDNECESCDGSGRIKVEVTVSWSTIKAIWEKGADHFAAAPAPGGE